MKKVIYISIPLLLTFIVSQAQDATSIIKKSDDRMRGSTSYSEMTMKIVRPSYERSISMKNWQKGNRYSMILITAPAREKGQVFLKRGNEMWNWIPNISRMIKLPPSMMSQSWMGSDYTNDDLIKQSSIVVDYDHKILSEEEIRGHKTWKIELIPKPDAPVVWGKIIAWVDKENYNQLRVEFYDEENELVNTQILKNIREMDGREIPTTWEMIPADEPDQKTVIELEKIEFNQTIADGFFSQQNMKRIR